MAQKGQGSGAVMGNERGWIEGRAGAGRGSRVGFRDAFLREL